MENSRKLVLLGILSGLEQIRNQFNQVIKMVLEDNWTVELDDDDDDDNDELVYVASVLQREVHRIQNFLEDVVDRYDAFDFRMNFRLSRNAFEKILTEIQIIQQSEKTYRGRNQINLRNQFMAVIWLLANQESYRSVGERFDIPKGTLSKTFVRIINFINKLAPKYIKWPMGQHLVSVKNKFSRNSAFKEAIGAIDGTYIAVKCPADQRRSYTNRKCFTSMTLQAICDTDLRYIDCYAGWPSSVPDIRIFKNSDIYFNAESDAQKYFPNGEYILGDKAYSVLHWCIPPYISRSNLTPKQILFNKRHASIRQVIERSFALLFGRFRRLNYLDLKRIDWAPATILACCVLHNICIDFENEDDISEFIIAGEETQARNSIIHSIATTRENNQSAIDKRDEICNRI